MMAFEDIKARIAMLLEQMVNQPTDKHQLAEQIHEILGELKATGMPLPQDLVEIEAKLEAEFEGKKPTGS